MILDGIESFLDGNVYYSPNCLGGNENSWMVMSTTPQIFLDGNEHYHPRIFTTLQNHNKSVKKHVLHPSFFISTILYF